MHELAMARAMIDTAEREAKRAGAAGIRKLRCRIGVLRQIDRQLLTEAFEMAAAGTACAGARLEVEATPIFGECPHCERRFPIWGDDWRCPDCGNESGDAIGGDEMELVSIDAVIDEAPRGNASANDAGS